jgi:sulfite reductase (ferredoxin)
LLQKSVQCNTQHGILNDFDKHFYETGIYKSDKGFRDEVMRMNETEPSADFAGIYVEQAIRFTNQATAIRESMLATED